MTACTDDLLEQLATLPYDWHDSGTMGSSVLSAMARHMAAGVGASLETGTGKTTLLMSHLSARHLVFAIDGGNSMAVTKASPLLRSEHVQFIEGPTQRTLLSYQFTEPLDVVLIDGPHGYPFPELEYWAVYRHIRPGGLLIVDDIHIPTVHGLFAFLCEEPMFDLVERVGNTAFFRRTTAATFDPYCDGWYQQPYNLERFPIEVEAPRSQPSTNGIANLARLQGLADTWKQSATRVAIFGTGAHTTVMLAAVPALGQVAMAYLDSDPSREGQLFAGKPIHRPEWAEGNCDVVLCSSSAHELAQMAVMDRINVKVIPSHIASTARKAA